MLRAGNKPTGFTAGVVFLNLNGYSLAVQDDEVVGRAFEAVVEHRITWEQLAQLFRPMIIPYYTNSVVPIRPEW